jgi:hypothetical protein
MTPDEQPDFPSNLLSERYLCVEWACETGRIKKLAETHPLARINRMSVRQYLDRAIGYLVQAGTPLREIWGLADLVAPDAFKKILDAALASSPASAQCMSLVLVTTAREWVGLSADELEGLEEIARRLPAVAEKRRIDCASRQLTKHIIKQLAGPRLGLKHLA